MKRYKVTLEGQTYDVKVLDDPRQGQVRVEVNGETLTVGVEAVPVAAGLTAREVSPTIAPPPASENVATAGDVVAAPLPGVIKSIAVRPGQRVAPNDELLIIEAMKMDNVIRAARVGAVGAIYVTEGRQVAYGEPLLDFVD